MVVMRLNGENLVLAALASCILAATIVGRLIENRNRHDIVSAIMHICRPAVKGKKIHDQKYYGSGFSQRCQK